MAVTPVMRGWSVGHPAPIDQGPLVLGALPPGGRLALYGFGASAHLAAQVALSQGSTVHVLTRSTDAQRLATEIGAASVGGAYDEPPEPLDAAILFVPVGDLVPVALAALGAVLRITPSGPAVA